MFSDRIKIYFDARWIGSHGIGRFAHALNQRLRLPHLQIGGSPVSPIDPLRMSLAMLSKASDGSIVFSPGYNASLFIVRPYILQ